MAVIKYRLMKDGGSGVFDTIHLETDSNMVLHGDTDLGQYLNTLASELAGKAASGHTHTLASLGAAAANHSHSGYLTAHQSLAGYVPTSRTVNGKKLTGNISLTAADVGAAASSHTHAYAATSHKHTAADITDINNISGITAVYGHMTITSVRSAKADISFNAKAAIVTIATTDHNIGVQSQDGIIMVTAGNTNSAYYRDDLESIYEATIEMNSNGTSLKVTANSDYQLICSYLAFG
ncbi:MAG: hypothetical protein NC489_08415 [Ruminococcus flavefaciens]|nr:hypothetical protein [Ruminococcus flavefaciens]